MLKKRDYRAEYARRISRGMERGLTRSQARGHAKAYEARISKTVKPFSYDPRLEAGLKEVRSGKSVTKSAKIIHVAPERLRKYLAQAGVAVKQSGRWNVGDDLRQRVILIFSEGNQHTITVANYDTAFQVGRYLAAVKSFLESNDPSVLKPFKGQSIADVNGKRYVFETRPNVLYRLNASMTESFEEIYKVVV